MTDTGSLLEVFPLACWRCGEPDPDTFEDQAALGAVLEARRPLTAQVQIMEPFGIGTLQAADLEAAKPVHARCLRPPAQRPEREKPPYDLLRSVL